MGKAAAFAALAQAGQLWLPSRVSTSGVSPTAGARLCCQHTTPGHAFHQLHQRRRELHSTSFDRCTLHFDPRNLPFVCVTARLSASHGLASYNLLASFSIATLACSSTATPDKSRSVFAARAAVISRCTSRIGLFSASHMLQLTSTLLAPQNSSEQP